MTCTPEVGINSMLFGISSQILIAVCCVSVVNAQNDSVLYTPNFEFTEGIYQSFEEFRKNSQSIKEKALIQDNPETQYVFGNIFAKERIGYKDTSGQTQILSRKNVWGFCSKGVIYVKVKGNFHKLFKIGALSYFAESHHTFFYSPPAPPHALIKPIRYIEYLIDYHTGVNEKLNLESFMAALQRDAQLYQEFIAIGGDRKKRQQIFIYLNKYNERNPIYFPKTN